MNINIEIKAARGAGKSFLADRFAELIREHSHGHVVVSIISRHPESFEVVTEHNFTLGQPEPSNFTLPPQFTPQLIGEAG